MTNRQLLIEIVDELEANGVERDAYQLYDVIDVEALERVVDSATTDFEIRFTVEGVQVVITPSTVTVRK